MNQEQEFQKRMTELSERAFSQSRFVFTDFLNPAELSVVLAMGKDGFPADFSLEGGYEEAERKMVRFGTAAELGYEEPFPIHCLQIYPAAEKFAEPLSHRDYLGAVMAMGLDREKFGDLILKGSRAYLFANSLATEYILKNLDQVRHTAVKVQEMLSLPQEVRPRRVRLTLIVASNRADAVIAQTFHLSRDESLQLFREGKVFRNGILSTENAKELKPHEIVSVRGKGKFEFAGELGTTRKNRRSVQIDRYE